MTGRLFACLATAAAVLAAGSAPAQNQAQPPAPAKAQPFVVASTNGGTGASTDRGFANLADAIAAIGGGTGTILVAPGTYEQCAVQKAGRVTIQARVPGSVIFDHVACEEKAGLVLRGRSATINGILFQNYAVSDGNGAGIRLEHGDLTVSNSLFRNSEEGILTADDPRGTITIDRSTFSHLGRCDRDLSCAHSVYVGHYGKLIVTRSRFDAGKGGHYLKSRANVVKIDQNSFDDSHGHLTNYMIDLSNGASGEIVGNVMVQGRDKDNWSAFIALGAEGKTAKAQPPLVVRGNMARFVPGLTRNSSFVADWIGEKVTMSDNQLAAGISRYDRR